MKQETSEKFYVVVIGGVGLNVRTIQLGNVFRW